MILELVTLEVRPGQSAAFEAAFAEAERLLPDAPGYLGHELQRCLEVADRYALLIRWASVADHEEGFRRSPGYLRWKALLHHFYDPFPTVLHFERVAGGAP